MSERKGQPHVAERERMWVDPVMKAKLLKYVQSKMKSRKGITMKMVLGMFVDKCVKQDLYDPDWEEKLVASEKAIDDIISTEGCHKLAKGKNDSGVVEYSCVAYNEEGVVRLKNLGKVEIIAKARCQACGKDREVKAGLRERDDRIIELEDKIQMKARTRNKVPICNGGAILTDEGSSFRSCRKRPGLTVSVEKYCRVLTGGGTLPCALFAQVELAEGPK